MLTRGKAEQAEKPRRFYKAAQAAPAEGGFHILLDGRAVRTPAGPRARLPTAALAELVAAEWAAQGDEIDIASMPATRLAFSTLDFAAQARAAMAAEIARYAGADLLCYRAEGPESLVRAEAQGWDPLLAWAEEALGIALEPTSGLIHRAQPPASLERARALAEALDDFALTGLAAAAALFKSAVLAFALQRGWLAGMAALELSRLDEAFQEARWGTDAEAAERTAGMRAEAEALERWFRAAG